MLRFIISLIILFVVGTPIYFFASTFTEMLNEDIKKSKTIGDKPGEFFGKLYMTGIIVVAVVIFLILTSRL